VRFTSGRHYPWRWLELLLTQRLAEPQPPPRASPLPALLMRANPRFAMSASNILGMLSVEFGVKT
jgi:hypothetical protein